MKKFIIVFVLLILLLAVVIRNCSGSTENDDGIDDIEDGLALTGSTEETTGDDNLLEEMVLSVDDDEFLIPITLRQVKEQILNRKAYIVSYNTSTKCPNWVAWHLTQDHTDGPYSRQGVPYYMDDGTIYGIGAVYQETCRNGYFVDMEAEEPRQKLSDWTRDYNMSHGHICPAGDNKWDKTAMNQSFLLTNMCPQDEKLNGGGWKKLEEKCRSWANRYGSVYIVAGPMFVAAETRTMGEGGIHVPNAFFKVVCCLSRHPKTIGFVYMNDSSSQSMMDCVCTVDDVEELAGFDFFSLLPDSLENVIEASADLSEW